MSHVAKLFKNGRSQAVRLPAEFRFEESEVYIRRDPVSGDVVLSRHPGDWDEFFELIAALNVPQDFMSDRNDEPPQVRSAPQSGPREGL
jgi:antitoxin VapB